MILVSQLELLANAFVSDGADGDFFRGAAYALAKTWGLSPSEVIHAVHISRTGENVDTDLLRRQLYMSMSDWEVDTIICSRRQVEDP